MQILEEALAGTLESSDLFVRITPTQGPLEFILKSEVEHQFGDQIRKVVMETLGKFDLTDGAIIIIEDKGALDCVIRARVETAIMRAVGNTDVNWRALS